MSSRNRTGRNRGPRALWRDRRAGIAVEAAMFVPMLVVALAAVVDFGGYIRQGMELKQALRSAAQFALDLGAIGQANYNDNDAIKAQIEPVFLNAAQLTAPTLSSVDTTCVCPDGLSGDQYCTGTDAFVQCSNELAGARYLMLTATSTYQPYFTFFPWFSDSTTVEQSLSLRVQ